MPYIKGKFLHRQTYMEEDDVKWSFDDGVRIGVMHL